MLVAGLCVRKHVTSLHGKYGRALYVLGLTVDPDLQGGGVGSAVLEACRQMVRAGVDDTTECHIFAQCVKHKFWTDIAGVSVDAKALNYQMLMVDVENGHHFTDCEPRSILVRPDAPRAVP